MNGDWMVRAIWGAGFIHSGIVAANVPLPGRLRVRERLAGVPLFIRQIFYVHWLYIVIVVGMFAALCFGFAGELARGTGLGRFLSGFLCGFWLLRIVLQLLILRPGGSAGEPHFGFALSGIAGRVGGGVWGGGVEMIRENLFTYQGESMRVGILRLRPDFAPLRRGCAQDDKFAYTSESRLRFSEVTL